MYVGQPATPANPNAEATRSVPRYHHSETTRHPSVNLNQDREEVNLVTFGVCSHKTIMDVLVLSTLYAVLGLLIPDACPEALEAHGNLVPMKQDDVSDCARVDTEEGTVDHRVGSTEVSSRVVHVLVMVIQPSIIQRPADIVQLAKVVVHPVGVDRKISRRPGVAVVNSKNDDAPEEHAEAFVQGGKCWHHLSVEELDRVGK